MTDTDADLPIELSPSKEWSSHDQIDVQRINEFFENGCKCQFGKNGESCIKSFDKSIIESYILSCRELDHDQLDIMIMGQLSSLTNLNGTNTKFLHRGLPICRETFCFIHGIKKRRFEGIQKRFNKLGVSVRDHGNKGRIPKNTTSFTLTHDVKIYIEEYAERHGLFLPGRTPGHRLDRDDTLFLPSHESKASVHRQYTTDCQTMNFTPVSYDVFLKIWNTFLPHIHIIDPRTDLCFQCQQNNDLIIRSTNTDDESKKEAIKKQQDHLMEADIQSSDYRYRIQISKKDYQEKQPDLSTSKKQSNSVPISSCYSFDFAQQVSYPSNPDQPGAIFFKTPRKVGVFGINNEVLNMQVNYLVDEAVETGKGANTVISYVHHYLETYGVGEMILHLQADNCAGQNKNNTMIQYLCWRVLCGLHSNITLNFMIAGHTKFSVDRCFGLFKRKYTRTFCSSLFDIAKAVDSSSEIGANISQLVGLPNGQILVPVYNWKDYLDKMFKKVPGISKYHHFRFTHEKPGYVCVRLLAHSKEADFKLLRHQEQFPWDSNDLPETVQPDGLSIERKNYLFKEIRKFCRDGTEDLVAPKP